MRNQITGYFVSSKPGLGLYQGERLVHWFHLDWSIVCMIIVNDISSSECKV